jgi:hypothetical protein
VSRHLADRLEVLERRAGDLRRREAEARREYGALAAGHLEAGNRGRGLERAERDLAALRLDLQRVEAAAEHWRRESRRP